MLELLRTANEMVETLLLPEATIAAKRLVDLARREFLPLAALELDLG
jgi:hypothetical protein